MSAFENIAQLKSLFKKCAEDEKDVWRHSNNETSRIRFEARNNVLNQYQKEIEELAGDILDLCKDLIDSNKDIQFKEYHDVFDEINNSSLWLTVIPLIVNNYNRLKFVEKKEREEGWNYYIEYKGLDFNGCPEQDLILEGVVNGKVVKEKIEGIYRENRELLEYARWKNTFEYKLCSPLSEYVYNKGVDVEKVMGTLLETLAQAVCLYIALKNEKVKLYRQNGYFVDAQTQAAEGATKNKPEAREVEFPAELDTEEGRELLRKVIEAGFCNENYEWDETKWTDGEDLDGLVYFVEKANRKLKLQKKQTNGVVYTWKPFDTLFTYRGKTVRKDGKTQLQMIRKNLVRYQRNKKRFEPKKSVKDRIDPLFS